MKHYRESSIYSSCVVVVHNLPHASVSQYSHEAAFNFGDLIS